MLSTPYAVARQSVCPSVTRVDHSMQFSPKGSHIPLVFEG